MTRPADWWGTPADPGRWFEPETLAAHRRDRTRSRRFQLGLALVIGVGGAGPVLPSDLGRAAAIGSAAAGLVLLGVALVDRARRTGTVGPDDGPARYEPVADAIVVPDWVTAGSPELVAWVRRHEEAHRRGRHHRAVVVWGLLVAVVAAVFVTAVWTATDGRPGVVRLAGTVAAVAAWAIVARLGRVALSRAQERAADRLAFAGGVPARPDLRWFLLGAGDDPAPDRWARWWGTHPPPAERLAAADRVAATGIRHRGPAWHTVAHDGKE